ncbi:Ctr86p KNAG_0I02550 [Huiozyma naganishii CBS 8797]|uniref:Ataxin-10 homolog n=1 Tax=Huiozyma naganishii (strain ATCC MYA-139 / BCRC 22969 / CBS 8797 / KCTC 17520 / NBRC 10181 / NCYC 3082 / Yp74L-3) TaxID=1071383 RepID=J7RAZ5_HUIN7|nr:hypothetical protein KNAG_0I02550 [Kazachstania naganishii CBS 8797]CCK72040.1 hypothetical protein KNAG_0I02550 [Kazachstania naganishii CBS 8797]
MSDAAVLIEEDDVIDNIDKVLASCPHNLEIYESVLKKLNPIVVRSSEDEEYRNKLAQSFFLWKQLKTSISGCRVEKILKLADENHLHWYLRTLRGVIVLMRNLSVSNQEIPLELGLQNVVIKLFTIIASFHFTYENMETSLYVASVSFLHNISKTNIGYEKIDMDSLMIFLQYPTEHPDKNQELLTPFLLYFVNLASNDDFLYSFFRQEARDKILYSFLLQEIISDYTNIQNYTRSKKSLNIGDTPEELDFMDFVLLKLFITLSSNESFGFYLEKLDENPEKTEECIDFLEVLQLVITSKEKWNKPQLIGIMSWCYKIFDHASKDLKEYFKKGKDDEMIAAVMHKKLLFTLGIIAGLSEYEDVLQFLLSYGGLETLVCMLRVLQDNLLRINFVKDGSGNTQSIKTTDSLGSKVEDMSKVQHRVDFETHTISATNFPEVKLLVIEILTHLTYRKKEVQDRIRELHGLELVLSNCVIDDNDPFIKERSIICVKFLLENNAANQDFVAKLEAKRAANEDVLEEAGYEVKIDGSGQIKLQEKT